MGRHEKTPFTPVLIAEVACPFPIDKTFDYRVPDEWPETDPDHLLGRRVWIPFGRRQAVGLILRIKETSEASPEQLKTVSSLFDSEPLLTPPLIELARWMADRTASSIGEAAFALLPPGRGNPKSFKDPGSTAHLLPDYYPPVEHELEFTHDQKAASDALHHAIYDHSSQTFLLHGVAAAGKTEVYMAAVKDVLTQGKTALILVPEIGLSIELHERFKRSFGDSHLLIWHSDMPIKDRIEGWWKMKRGEVSIVIGARSAALAPLPNLGLIVVDEEHDSSYKEDRKPRFHARDIAVFRARQNHAVAVMSSATPSLEVLQACLSGEAVRLELHQRAIAAGAPKVRIVDVSKERFKGAVSLSLQDSIEERLKSKEQTILFLNKRGFHRFLICSHCEWVFQCPNCRIALVQHGKKMVRCHYCGHQEPPPAACPKCNHKKLHSGGFGTQRVAEEIQERFPWAKVLRWDRDSVSKRGKQSELYEAVKKGEADILVGTQMVAQGFNFPKVTLVGVIDADGPLHLPDFRSAEKTFQIVTQVAGRAGRAMVSGEVLVQTRNPHHYAMENAVRMDSIEFAKEELAFREELSYPPFTHLVQVVMESEVESEALLQWFDGQKFESPVGVLGPTPVKRARKGKPRTHVLFKVPKAVLMEFNRRLKAGSAARRGKWTINVDPESVY